MFFINKNELFIALDAWEEKKIEFLKFDINSKKVTTLRKLNGLSEDYCYLEAKNYLLYMEDSINGSVYILDLSTNKVIGELPTNNNGMISCFDINKSGTKIVYMENDSIKIFDIKTKQTKVILKFSPHKVSYLVKFIENRKILYSRGEAGALFDDLVIIDSQGKRVKKLNIQINGSTYIVEDGNKMIIETGF
jgi:WD40 repeat protein